jgi:hypothetical protein
MNTNLSKTRIPPAKRRRDLRHHLWGDVKNEDLWLRTQNHGFTTIPRTMSIILRIIDKLSDKGAPLSATYLALWCFVFDEAFVEIRNPKEMVFEAGFSGARGENTWRLRMRKLVSLGFLKSRSGVAGEFQYVLILNPIKVIASIYENHEKDEAFTALLSKLSHVGANDLLISESEIVTKEAN